MEKTQREYYLNEQMKAIQRWATTKAVEDRRTRKLRLKNTKLSKAKASEAEMKKLRQMLLFVINLDWLLSLPWGNKKKVIDRCASGARRGIMASTRSRTAFSNILRCRHARILQARSFVRSSPLARPHSADRQSHWLRLPRSHARK
ncbi:MAG: hypothetical protein R3C27_12265 [Hyphomonadaceae bacterium]